MTGYGRGEVSRGGVSATVEVRGVNNRFLDVTARMPRSLSQREKDVKEIVRTFVSRGGLTVSVTLEEGNDGVVPMTVNKSVARSYARLLNDLRKAAKIREQVRLEHLLKFSEVFEVNREEETDERVWSVVEEALRLALEDFDV